MFVSRKGLGALIRSIEVLCRSTNKQFPNNIRLTSAKARLVRYCITLAILKACLEIAVHVNTARKG